MLHVPRHVPYVDRPRWLREEVECPCGRGVGCPEMRVGFLGPEPCATVEEWTAEYAATMHRTPEQCRADETAWWALQQRGADKS
jgi:hypothetical protein